MIFSTQLTKNLFALLFLFSRCALAEGQALQKSELPLTLSSKTRVRSGAPFAFFSPPKGWDIANPSLFKREVKIGFVQSKKKIFSPAVSLTIEKVGKVTLATYLQAVRKNYGQHRDCHYRELGPLKTASGAIHLALIDKKSECGPLRILQGVSIHNGYAIIQTGTALKKDFPSVRPDFSNCFRSLTLASDLFSSLSNPREKNALKKMVDHLHCDWKEYQKKSKERGKVLFFNSDFQQNVWQPFTKNFTATFDDQGACWQLLAIRVIQNSLINIP